MSEAKLLKHLFSPTLVKALGKQIHKADAKFNNKAFVKQVNRDLDPLELMARAQLIADTLHLYLPQKTITRYALLRAILHPDTSAIAIQNSDDCGLRGWAVLPLTLLVGQHGLDSFDESLQLLKDMTSRFSAEFAIRYFLLHDQEQALSIISPWVHDANPHVRRLASEGTRPRLPWAMQLPQLIADPSPTIPLLDHLKDDAEEYVRRSVANHLNDISKDHPKRVSTLTNDWLKNAEPPRERLLQHACRTLIKDGHVATLRAFGYHAPKIEIDNFKMSSKHITLGNSAEFSALIQSAHTKSQALIIDYVLHFRKANGETKAKVFKGSKKTLKPGEHFLFAKKLLIKAITTRKYYPGEQFLSLRINGIDFGKLVFRLSL